MATTVADSMAPLASSMKLSVGGGQGQSCCFAMARETQRSGQSPHQVVCEDAAASSSDLSGVCRPAGNGGGRVEPHGIRVLTPSEIMRTLPSIGSGHPAANYGGPAAHHAPPHQHLHQSMVAAGVATVGGTVRETLLAVW